MKRRIRTHRTSDRGVIEFAKELRKNKTDEERALWERLRRKALGGYRFRQQHPIGTYIADFYCAEARLVVEVDGGIHRRQRENDSARTAQFEVFRYRVVRFRNEQILDNVNQVLATIEQLCREAR